MSPRSSSLERALWSTLAIAFAALTAWALMTAGLDGLIAFLHELGPIGLLTVVDLLLALLVGVVLMIRDGRERGVDVRAYLLLTLLTGSLGLLVYLARRTSGSTQDLATRMTAAEGRG